MAYKLFWCAASSGAAAHCPTGQDTSYCTRSANLVQSLIIELCIHILCGRVEVLSLSSSLSLSLFPPLSLPLSLPSLLQFLLSQSHRLQALELLGRFLDLGPWAVHSALSVGIFPYVLKLLGSKLRELQPILVFIWAKILSVDPVRGWKRGREGGRVGSSLRVDLGDSVCLSI